MALVIEYYSGDKKLCAVRAPTASILDAIEAARDGLLQHNARHARVIDVDRGGKLVEMIHRDVLP